MGTRPSTTTRLYDPLSAETENTTDTIAPSVLGPGGVSFKFFLGYWEMDRTRISVF